MSPKSKIFIYNTNEFDSYLALKKAFTDLGVKLDFKNVVIKLNLCSLKTRETGATSDPIVVEQLVKFLNEKNIHVSLVESNSGSKNADLAFQYLGFKSLEKKYDVNCINLSKDKFSIKKIDGYFLKSIKIPEIIESSDFFITHPKLKTHSSHGIYITGALKNQFGCLMEKNKAKYHSVIHEIIADLNQVFTPDLVIMDAIIAMTGYGPTDGIPQRLNLLLASIDPVAIDALGASLFGFNPYKIKYLKLSSQKGIGIIDSLPIGNKLKTPSFDLFINNLMLRSFEVLSSIGVSSPG